MISNFEDLSQDATDSSQLQISSQTIGQVAPVGKTGDHSTRQSVSILSRQERQNFRLSSMEAEESEFKKGRQQLIDDLKNRY